MPDWLEGFYTDEVLAEVHEQFRENKNFNLLLFLSEKGLGQFSNLDWQQKYDPLRFKYQVAEPPAFARSEEFSAILEKVLGFPVAFEVLECRKFGHGDYTLLYDELAPGKGLVVSLELSGMDEAWGGYTSFIQGSEEVVRQVPVENALFVINQEGLHSFTKYVNHHAGHPRVFLYGILQKR